MIANYMCSNKKTMVGMDPQNFGFRFLRLVIAVDMPFVAGAQSEETCRLIAKVSSMWMHDLMP